MTTKKTTLLTAFVLATTFASPVSTKAQVIINELMQSNIDCVMDDINEFPDSWVELYNSGTTAVNLNTLSISDENDPNKAWSLPNKTYNLALTSSYIATRRSKAFTLHSAWSREKDVPYISSPTAK